MRIVVTGSVAYDYLMAFPGHFHEHIVAEKIKVLSVSFLVDSLKKQRGGTASNIAYTLGLLGRKPEVVAAVGEDFEEYRRWLESSGVETKGVVVVPGEFTSSCFINTDLDSNQITAFYPGAMTHAHTLKLDGRGLSKDDLVLISPNDPAAMVAYAEECLALGVETLYDPSMQIPRLSADDLRAGIKSAKILAANDYEFGMMAEKLGVKEAELHAIVPVCIVTRGGDGASIYVDGNEHVIPVARPTAIVNPTGAGDAFRSGLVAGLALGHSWDICGRMGSLAGAYAVEQVGPQEHSFTPEAFLARYRENFGDPGVPLFGSDRGR